MALPSDMLPPDRDMLMRRITDLEAKVAELAAARTAEATTIGSGGTTIKDNGAFTMIDANGKQRVFIGLDPDKPLADGNPQPVVYFRDGNGRTRFAVYDPDPIGDGYQPVVWIVDHLGGVVYTTDINGGAAEPWIPIPIAVKAFPNAFLDTLGTDLTVPVSACNGSAVWEGRIGKVSHPRIQYDGVFGRVTGTTGSPTYTLKVGGTTIDSFGQTAYGATLRGPFDISEFLGVPNVVVQLTLSASGTGTDRIAAQPNAVYLRQT